MKRFLAIAFTVIGLVFASVLPAGASTAGQHGPDVELYGNYYFQNEATALWLHAHAFNQALSDVASANQTWDIQDLQVIGGTSYVEVRLHGTNDCANAVFADGTVFLDGCTSGRSDLNELWYIPSNGAGADWFYSAAVTSTPYWTEGSNHYIALLPPGYGNYALWGEQCNNC